MADHLGRKSLLVADGGLAVYPPVMLSQGSAAQAPAAPGWQIAAGSKLVFEVGSVKRDPGQFRPPNWVATDRFDIQARAEGSPSKDQMRLMMQSLLAHASTTSAQAPYKGLQLSRESSCSGLSLALSLQTGKCAVPTTRRSPA